MKKLSAKKLTGLLLKELLTLNTQDLKHGFRGKTDRLTLREAGIFHSTRKDTPTVEKKISGIDGKPRYYAINGDALRFAAQE